MANPSSDYPTSLHTATDISDDGGNYLGATSPTHTDVHGKIEQEVLAIQTKVGIGASPASSATTGQALVKQANGQTNWADVGGAVDSVNGQTGVVVLDTDDVTQGSTNLYSQWVDDSPGIAYPGHIAVGATAAVDTTPPLSGLTGTTSTNIVNFSIQTDGSVGLGSAIVNALSIDASANNSANWIGQNGLVEIASGNNKNYTGLVSGDGGAAYHYGSGTITEFDGVFAITENNSSGNITLAQGLRSLSFNYGSGTIAAHYGISSQVVQVSGTNVITQNRGLHILSPLMFAGSIGTNYGISVAAQTAGTTANYGIAVEAAGTNTLWLSSNSDTTTEVGGIVIGTSKDTNLYRSAANTLATDDTFSLVGNGSWVGSAAATYQAQFRTAINAGVNLSTRAKTSQTANQFEVLDSSGTTIRYITVTGSLSERVVSVADATSITPNNDTSDTVTQTNTQAAGTLTINAPSGTAYDGQELTIRIKSTNVQTFSFNAIYIGSLDTPLPVSTYAGSTWCYMKFIYNATDTEWHLLAITDGY